MQAAKTVPSKGPKKLIRTKIVEKLSIGEWEIVEDKKELNKLFALKIREELSEIVNSDYASEDEFADLLNVLVSFAKANGITLDRMTDLMDAKIAKKGNITCIALTNLNPNNPSNELYFDKTEIAFVEANDKGITDMIFNKIKDDGYQYGKWFVGITTDEMRKTVLFSGHNVDEYNGKWVYGDCFNAVSAKNIFDALVKAGCFFLNRNAQSGTVVYAFKMTEATRPWLEYIKTNDGE